MTSSKSRIHSFHPESYGDLKSAVRALLHASGGEARAAERCRVSKSTLSEYGNPGGIKSSHVMVLALLAKPVVGRTALAAAVVISLRRDRCILSTFLLKS